MRGEEEHNEGVPLSILAALPFHHLLKERERQRREEKRRKPNGGERIDGEELPAVTL